jgi:hypothetical protein
MTAPLRVCAAGLAALVLSACGAGPGQPPPPTATLAPIVSQTPRFTATPVPSRTPLPTATETASTTPVPPTPSNTFTPSPTPPVVGSIASASDVNVREGPDVSFGAIEALPPGTGVLILGVSGDARWLNIRMDDGDEGWVSAALVRIQPSPTPLPSLTPTLNRTAQALGTAYPTALIGGQPVTPTPPRAVLTLTPEDLLTQAAGTPATAALPNLAAIEQTATALVGLGVPILTTREPSPAVPLGGPTGGPFTTAQPGTGGAPGTAPAGTATTQRGVGVPALCDLASVGGRPRGLAAGSTIAVFWRWYAATPELLAEHVSAVEYDVRLDGVRIDNWRESVSGVRDDGSGQVYREWYVPIAQPLQAGEHVITYRATWSRAISDGFMQFGPGTGTPEEVGSCTFTVGP